MLVKARVQRPPLCSLNAVESKRNKQKISKQLDTLDNVIKNIDNNNIQFGNLILYNFDIPTLKQKFKESNL